MSSGKVLPETKPIFSFNTVFPNNKSTLSEEMNILSCYVKAMLSPSSLYGYPLNINDHHSESRESKSSIATCAS